MKWIVVNIGCIECGVSSNIVGVFSDEAIAKHIADELNENNDWRKGGENRYEIFEMPELDVVAEEYVPFLGKK